MPHMMPASHTTAATASGATFLLGGPLFSMGIFPRLQRRHGGDLPATLKELYPARAQQAHALGQGHGEKFGRFQRFHLPIREANLHPIKCHEASGKPTIKGGGSRPPFYLPGLW